LNIGTALRAGIDPIAEVTVNGGSITDQSLDPNDILPRADIVVGSGALQYADPNDPNTTPSTGKLTVTHGNIDLEGSITVGNAENQATGSLIIAGNSLVNCSNLNLQNGSITLVADANSPPYSLPYITVGNSVNFNGGELIIDLSALTELSTGIWLIESLGIYQGNIINDVADVIANVTIIPAAGTTADQWSLEITSTDLGDNKRLILNLDAN